MDLHPSDRGTKGTFGGAICANGNLYCPCTPPALLTLGPLARGATEAEVATTMCAAPNWRVTSSGASALTTPTAITA